MAYTQTISLNSPADGATGQTPIQLLSVTHGGSYLPWEYWVNGELKLSYPQGSIWDASVNPNQLGMLGNEWQCGTTYTWYVHYANYATTRTWNGSEWVFTGLVYTNTSSRTFTTRSFSLTSPIPHDGDTYPAVYLTELYMTAAGPSTGYWQANCDEESSYYVVNGVSYTLGGLDDLPNNHIHKLSTDEGWFNPESGRTYEWYFVVSYNGVIYQSDTYTVYTLAGLGKARFPSPEDDEEGVYIAGIDAITRLQWSPPE